VPGGIIDTARPRGSKTGAIGRARKTIRINLQSLRLTCGTNRHSSGLKV
jgi:hypothetical protein